MLINQILEARNTYMKNTGKEPAILRISKKVHQELTKELEKELRVGDENAIELNKFLGMYIVTEDKGILEFNLLK
jgi:hypothetical protein